jgi:hypothetical protein
MRVVASGDVHIWRIIIKLMYALGTLQPAFASRAREQVGSRILGTPTPPHQATLSQTSLTPTPLPGV